MQTPRLWATAALTAVLTIGSSVALAAAQPNVIIILVDDLGYSDLGAFGGEMRTPNLDRLARTGTVLQTLYVAPTCSPTRAMLMSGTDNHLAGVGNMIEMMTPHIVPEQVGKPGYEGMLSDRVVTLPEVLKQAGYHTYMAGKWHLGGKDGFRPESRGFEQSFALMGGGSASFAQTAPMAGASDAPPPVFRENGAKVELPKDFFSTATYTDKLIGYIDAARADKKPFFGYLALTAPHLPLHAPDANLAKVRGRYDAGYDVLAARRVERMKKLGLVPKSTMPAPRLATVKPWARLTPPERATSARTMEAYAAMVENLDEHVGRLMDYLRKTEQLDNTVVLFMSDNGPEGNDWARDVENDSWIPKHFDNSLDNIGRANSFVFQGPGWGQVSAQPFRYYKAYTHEGGVRAPAFVNFPKRFPATRSKALVSVMDVMPTVLELAGVQHPGLSFAGRNVLPMQGVSLVSLLEGRSTAVRSQDSSLGIELMGRKALRKGDWKIVYAFDSDGQPGTRGHWALYDLSKDPGERTDLAQRHPAKLQEMLLDWQQYAQANNVVETGRDLSYPRRDY